MKISTFVLRFEHIVNEKPPTPDDVEGKLLAEKRRDYFIIIFWPFWM